MQQPTHQRYFRYQCVEEPVLDYRAYWGKLAVYWAGVVVAVEERELLQARWNAWIEVRWAGSRSMRPSTACLKIPSGRSMAREVSSSSHGAGSLPRIIAIVCMHATHA